MSTKKVLLLGSGFVTKPTVQILSDAGIYVTVACRNIESARTLCLGMKHTDSISLDVNDSKALDEQVGKHDIVVSLIPYTYHVAVIKSAIREKKHVVTTSYISPAIAELDTEAKQAGVTVMNEIGLDPGIDHLWALKTINEVHDAGGKILSFLSYCGGLPAPEASDNPLGYKFSWSPRGFLLASQNTARFWKDGKIEEIPGKDLMKSLRPYFIYPGFAFHSYPNRDSTPYKERYGIDEASTIIRGTLRYQGFAEFVKVLVDTGLLSEEKRDFLKQPIRWKEATQRIVNAESNSTSDIENSISSLANFSGAEEKERILAGMRWIGLFSDEKITPSETPLDALCATLEKKMQYGIGERDMVMLQHRFEIKNRDGTKETRTSTLCEYGDSTGYSAMARLVGTPCGIAVKQVLDGTISDTGIVAPLTPKINNPLMVELQKYGIALTEKTLA